MAFYRSVAEAPQNASDLDQLKNIFLATLSHEIRTPLSGVLGMLDLIEETNLTEEQREYVSAARLCAQNLFQLLNASLQYSAISTGQIGVERTEFSVREVVEAALHRNRDKVSAKDLRLFASYTAGLPEICIGDAIKIQEIVALLLDNAVKFTSKGSVEVGVTLEGAPPVLEIAVRDTGIGIAPHDRERIFASFEQLENGQARTFPGVGLGLALARKLTSLMGGDLSVESKLEEGSTFTVRIPVELPAPAPVLVRAVRQQAQARPPHILAVEDNPTGMKVLKHALSHYPAEIETVSDGRSAIAAATNKQFDLILMDLQMPDMSGLEATAVIRKMPAYRNVPIVALTADISDQTRRECLANGMQDYLSKPIDSTALWNSIRRHLDLA